jgi:hypothetical protein
VIDNQSAALRFPWVGIYSIILERIIQIEQNRCL